jgi:hypothetical protein
MYLEMLLYGYREFGQPLVVSFFHLFFLVCSVILGDARLWFGNGGAINRTGDWRHDMNGRDVQV